MPLRELHTAHLKLVPKTRDQVRADIAAMSPVDKAQLSPVWLTRVAASAHVDPWVHGYSLVERDTNAVVGSCGFKGPPAEGIVEIAYGVAIEQRGRGYATEAAAALVAYAFDRDDVSVVRAHTLPDADASQRVLAKCGFEHVGEVDDPEDGPVCRFEKRRSAAMSCFDTGAVDDA
ncbi:MAG TPA: GNAT family protein [Gammaproteobacteria bacterium]|nr:GNAT family protein [Gammaproteobacteria bacterium]